METTEQYNAEQLVTEVRRRLEVIEHEAGQIAGLLEDLAIYLPKAALNPNHKNDGFLRA